MHHSNCCVTAANWFPWPQINTDGAGTQCVNVIVWVCVCVHRIRSSLCMMIKCQYTVRPSGCVWLPARPQPQHIKTNYHPTHNTANITLLLDVSGIICHVIFYLYHMFIILYLRIYNYFIKFYLLITQKYQIKFNILQNKHRFWLFPLKADQPAHQLEQVPPTPTGGHSIELLFPSGSRYTYALM